MTFTIDDNQVNIQMEWENKQDVLTFRITAQSNNKFNKLQEESRRDNRIGMWKPHTLSLLTGEQISEIVLQCNQAIKKDQDRQTATAILAILSHLHSSGDQFAIIVDDIPNKEDKWSIRLLEMNFEVSKPKNKSLAIQGNDP